MCRLVILLIAFFVRLGEPAVVSAQSTTVPSKGKKFAVLVGVNEYTKPRFEALKYAEKDMTDLKGVLEKAGFQVTLMLGSGRGDAEATRENIQKVLLDKDGVLKAVSQDDTVLVAFSGHGEQIPVEKVEVPFFCPKHAVSGDPDTQVSINDVLDTLDKRGGGSNLVLVDACRKFSARVQGKKSGASMDRAKVQSLREGIGVMFACSDRQEALEHAKAGDGHGLFFYSVLEAMRTAEGDGQAQVTWEQLVPKIRTKVRELTDAVDTTTPENQRQRPQYIGNFSRDPVLFTGVVAKKTKGEDPPPPPKVSDKVRITKATSGYLDRERETKNLTLGTITKGDTATLLETDDKNGVYFLEFEDGSKAWVDQTCCMKLTK